MTHVTVTQDPDDHLFYDVDWTTWLASRNFVVGDITGFAWTVSSTAVITGTTDAGAVSRVYIRAVPDKTTVQVICQISLTNPDTGDPVKMSHRFDIKGAQVS